MLVENQQKTFLEPRRGDTFSLEFIYVVIKVLWAMIWVQ
jgi:hypothetical protein